MGAFITCIQSQLGWMNCLYLTSWCRHHKTVLVLKAAPEEHNAIRMLYGDVIFCLPTHVLYKISTKANIQMVNMVERLCTSNLHARTSLLSAVSCWACTSNWFWYDIILVGKGNYQFWTFFEGCLSRTRTVYLLILMQLILISWKLYSLLCVK